MLLATSLSNGVGDLITAAFWVLVGAWLLYRWPRSVHRKIASGKLSEAEGDARLRRLTPNSGYVAILLGIGLACVGLFQMGFFDGFEKVVGVLMLAFCFALIAFVMRQKRRSRSR